MRKLVVLFCVLLSVMPSAGASDVGPCSPGKGHGCDVNNCAGKTITVTVTNLSMTTSLVTVCIGSGGGGMTGASCGFNYVPNNIPDYPAGEMSGGCAAIAVPCEPLTWGEVDECSDICMACRSYS